MPLQKSVRIRLDFKGVEMSLLGLWTLWGVDFVLWTFHLRHGDLSLCFRDWLHMCIENTCQRSRDQSLKGTPMRLVRITDIIELVSIDRLPCSGLGHLITITPEANFSFALDSDSISHISVCNWYLIKIAFRWSSRCLVKSVRWWITYRMTILFEELITWMWRRGSVRCCGVTRWRSEEIPTPVRWVNRRLSMLWNSC